MVQEFDEEEKERLFAFYDKQYITGEAGEASKTLKNPEEGSTKIADSKAKTLPEGEAAE